MVRRVVHGLIAILSGQAVNVAGNLLLVPLFLSYWSPAAYGEWLALFSLATYLVTLDFGANQAVSNRLTRAYARDDLAEYALVQHSALAFYTVVATTGTLLLGLIVWVAPIASWLGLREISSGDARVSVWLLSLAVLWALPTGSLTAIFRTTGNLAGSQWIDNAQRLLVLVLTALVLAAGMGVVGVAVVQPIPTVLAAVFVLVYVRRRLPALAPGLRRASLQGVRGLVTPSLLFFGITIAMALTQQGPVVLLSSALGGVAVATFVTSRALSNLIRQVVNAFVNSLWPDLTMMEARADLTRLRTTHRLVVVGTTTLCIAVAAALWYEGVEIIGIWTRGRIVPDATLFRLLLTSLVLQSPWIVSSAVLAATNRHAIVARSMIAASLVAILATALLVGRLGTWSAPIGLIIGEAVACHHFIIRAACTMVGEPYGRFAARLWLGMPVVAAVALGAGWVAHQVAWGPAPLRWCEVGVVTFVAAALASRVCWLPGGIRFRGAAAGEPGQPGQPGPDGAGGTGSTGSTGGAGSRLPAAGPEPAPATTERRALLGAVAHADGGPEPSPE